MTLSELLESELVLLKTPCASKDELVRELVERVFSTGRELPLPKDDVLNTIIMREKIGGTTLPSGLSVPHVRLRGFEGFILALGIPKEPLLIEGIEVRMMAMMVTSQSGIPWYLPVLAGLTKISRDSGYFSRLCGAEDFNGFIGILRERDQDLG